MLFLHVLCFLIGFYVFSITIEMKRQWSGYKWLMGPVSRDRQRVSRSALIRLICMSKKEITPHMICNADYYSLGVIIYIIFDLLPYTKLCDLNAQTRRKLFRAMRQAAITKGDGLHGLDRNLSNAREVICNIICF